MKMLLLTLSSVIIAVACCAVPGLAGATDVAIGSVVAVRGEVRAGNQGENERLLAIKSEVFPSDIIKTGNGRVQLLFRDNTIISLGSGTVMEIAAYQWNPVDKTGVMKTRVEEGAFRVLGGLITKTSPENFSTETPAATIGIRGSMYAGTYRDQQLQVVFLGGRGIFVDNGQGRLEIDQPGYGTRLATGSTQPPVRMQIEITDGGLVEGLDEVREDVRSEEGSVAPLQTRSAPEGEETTLPPPPERTVLSTTTSRAVDDTMAFRVATDISSNAVTTSSNDLLSGAAQNTTTTPLNMSGWSQIFLRRLDNGTLTAVNQYSLTARAFDGAITASLANGTTLAPFNIARYNPAGSYSGWAKKAGETVTENTPLGTLTTTRDVVWDNLGEFFLYEINTPGTAASIGGIDYNFQSLAFGGLQTPLTNLPSAGIDTYTGKILGGGLNPYVPSPDNSNDSIRTDMYVNWANRKVFGVIYDTKTPLATGGPLGAYPVDHMHYYGDLAAGTSSFQFVSGEGWTGPFLQLGDISTMDGTVTFGRFFGSQYQAFGFAANGRDYTLSDMTVSGQWQAAGGVFRVPAATEGSPRFAKVMSGYYVGLAEALNSPGASLAWQNTDGSANARQFYFSVDTFSGSVSGFLGGAPFGGAIHSAAIDDKRFIAEFAPGPNPAAPAETIKPEGSFIVTAAPALQFSDYASWGYWNLAYSGTSLAYHVHSPGAYWVAGTETTTAALADLRTANLTGTYVGPAYGARVDAITTSMSPLTGGTSNLTVAFGPGLINGTIGFDQGTLPLSGPVTWNPALSGNFIAPPVTGSSSSQVVGGFFGPGAAAMAGSFDVSMPGDGKYIGVFGGNR